MNLKFYQADENYCAFLRKSDPCVPYINDEKSIRPFVGVLLTVNHINYFAPLTSPKPKHKKMKNQADFIKINGGEWGAINLNNMIPIHLSCLAPVDMKISACDNKADIDYKNLLFNQLSWCNANKARLLNLAEKLYKLVVSGKGQAGLADRCCNFLLLEKQYYMYQEIVD